MACKTSCKLCPHLVISQAVTFADDTLTINIPAGAYQNGEKYCIVVAQSLPDTTTINAPVVITIGAGTTAYPLTDCNCAQATAESIHTRYPRSNVCNRHRHVQVSWLLLSFPRWRARVHFLRRYRLWARTIFAA